ncbi:helix-turn-helix transcriptional regulator [Acetivibrio sp. MSJd-27]|uniref:helix-turn-helix transcriptional regulator n=1 Tax=Acetivibrio sp. MSJd-27 TaxID=2841523 RepID=UPI001C112B0D|nr:helix-turn-helix transcriptional regulator [Acetivibrio sp. MSJd-27]MBU5450995.1 helix-turn-helix domain-containing protein [Acetivibrio sp. MSJd-27]
MDTNLLKAKRVEHDMKQKDFAKALHVSVKTYCMKENADSCTFSGEQILLLKDLLNLSLQEINHIFFDGLLPEK